MKDKKGFTLVELLAVIVILAIILVIAVPKILNVIESTRTESMESTALLILDSAEREYATRLALGTLDQTNDRITCSDVASLSSTDYVLTAGATNCSLDFDTNGVATLFLYGVDGGKFSGKCIVGGTRDAIEASTDCTISM
jgi:type IV pilus assembly protein PilA